LFQKFTRVASYSLCKRKSSPRLSSMATSVCCDQHHPKARLPSHHLRVRRRCVFEWDGLDHGGHAAQGTESERRITGRRGPRQGTFYFATSKYQIHARKLDRLWPSAEVNRDSTRTKAFEGLSDCLTPGSCYENDSGAAQRLQSRCGIGSGTVNVVVSAELL